MKSRNPIIEFDKLQMYFGEPYQIDLENVAGSITIYQPTIGKIIEIGEKKFYATLNIFITNTTAYRAALWDSGIDWNTFSDFELFTMLYKGINTDVSNLIFGDLDFSTFSLFKKKLQDKESVVLYSEKLGIEINEDVYHHMCQYLRNVFSIFPEEELTKDSILKKWWVEKDKREQARAEQKPQQSSSIQAVISSCINHPGFKYKLSELKEIGVCQFYDSVRRLQVYESTTALMNGMYSGMIDSSKMKPDDYNFMKEI